MGSPKNIQFDLKRIRDNEVAAADGLNASKEFTKRKFNEIIDIQDKKFKADALVRSRDFTPRMMDFDTGTLQYSISGALMDIDPTNPNTLITDVGALRNHSFYAVDRKEIKKRKLLGVYDPTRSWVIASATTVFPNDSEHKIYLKVPTEEGITTSEIFVSEEHIDPLRDEGYIIYYLGYAKAVADGNRKLCLLFSNAKSGTDSSYEYIAYASDAAGTGFTLLPNPALDYTAVLATPVKKTPAVVADFAGLWYYRKGIAGKQIELSTSGGYFVYRYVGDTAWINISSLPSSGDDGRSPELSVQGGYISYRLVGDPAWINLVSILSLKGDPGPGVAAGGTTGQKLIKKSNADYDTEWVDDVVDKTFEYDVNFIDLLPWVFPCPVALKFTSQTVKPGNTPATLSVALNTNMAEFDVLTVTPTCLGLVKLGGTEL